MALQVVDRAIQSFGAEGVCQDQVLAATWAGLRTLRLADVSHSYITVIPILIEERFRVLMRYAVRELPRGLLSLTQSRQVHIQQIGQRELKRAPEIAKRHSEIRKKEKQLFEKYNVKSHL